VAPNAEREAFTNDVIQSGFRNTGIWPFDPEKILSNAKQNEGIANNASTSSEESIEDEARRVALSVLKERPVKTNTRATKVKLLKNTLYSPEDIINLEKDTIQKQQQLKKEKDLKQKKREEKKQQQSEFKEQRKKEKSNKKIMNTCKGCGKKWKGTGKWFGCEHCDMFWVCSGCEKTGDLLPTHENECGNKNTEEGH